MKTLEKTLKNLNRTLTDLEAIEAAKADEAKRIEASISALQTKKNAVAADCEKAHRVSQKIKDLIS